MNTINSRDLKNWYLENDQAKENAEKYFGSKQPSTHETGWYHPSGANWSYHLGIVGVKGTGENGIQSGTTKYFEIVTQFGVVKAARGIYIPEI